MRPSPLLSLLLIGTADAFVFFSSSSHSSSTFSFPRSHLGGRLFSVLENDDKVAVDEVLEATVLKKELFDRIDSFNKIQARVGKEEVDFGVRGGELDSKSRAPRNLAESWYARSPALGAAGEDVFKTIRKLQCVNPTPDPTQFLGTAEGRRCPLHGAWRLKFTTAADASFSSNSTRGEARASNVVDGVAGTITNVIEFGGPSSGLIHDGEAEVDSSSSAPPTLEQLRVKIQATAVDATRVRLRFKSVRARLTKFFGVRIPFGKRITLALPVPGPAITRVLFFFSRKERPDPFFNVLYLDEELRIHETGEGNFFVQERAPWGA
jgi:hypothetical protein